MELQLDPRWDWVDVSTMAEGPGTTFVKASCNHLKVEDVRDTDGELVAKLCRTCDKRWLAGRALDQ
jgi:hypothetical protein